MSFISLFSPVAKKIAVGLMSLAIFGGALGASYALFTSTAASQTDQVSTGTVLLNKNTSSLALQVSSLMPGQSASGTYNLTYAGSAEAWIGLDVLVESQRGPNDAACGSGASCEALTQDPASSLGLTLTNGKTASTLLDEPTRSMATVPCPTSAPENSVCSEATDLLVSSGDTHGADSGSFVTGEKDAIAITASLPKDAGNSMQGAAGQIIVTAHAVQAADNTLGAGNGPVDWDAGTATGGSNTPLSITTTGSTWNLIESEPFTLAFEASGGSGSDTWSISSGQLPKGLTLGSGKISGTAQVSGTFDVTVKVQDNSGASATKAITLVIAPLKLTLSATPSFSTTFSGTAQTVTLTTEDQRGNAVGNTAFTLSFTPSDTQGLWITAVNGVTLAHSGAKGDSYYYEPVPIPLYTDLTTPIEYGSVVEGPVIWPGGTAITLHTNSQGQVSITLQNAGVSYFADTGEIALSSKTFLGSAAIIQTPGGSFIITNARSLQKTASIIATIRYSDIL